MIAVTMLLKALCLSPLSNWPRQKGAAVANICFSSVARDWFELRCGGLGEVGAGALARPSVRARHILWPPAIAGLPSRMVLRERAPRFSSEEEGALEEEEEGALEEAGEEGASE